MIKRFYQTIKLKFLNINNKRSRININNTKEKELKLKLIFSFIFSLVIHIIFFPIFLIKWYFELMFKKTFLFFLLNFFVISCISVYFLFCYIKLPDINKLTEYKPVLSSKFYDRNGNLLLEVGDEKRSYIKINDIPKMLIYAFISAEDKSFYTNSGVDFIGLSRTVIQDFKKIIRRQRLAGASTITQQVVKNILLTNEYSFSRKLKEIILSYQISKTLPKDKIMEIYLNHIYLGQQSYGIVTASKQYFNKSVSQLTVPEMALLAAMPKAPSAINPFKNYNRAKTRRNWVLKRMLEDEYITEQQYEKYANTDIALNQTKDNNAYPFYAPIFFAEKNFKDFLKTKNEENIKNNMLNSGYKINLTIDSEIQKLSQEALNHTLQNYTKRHGFSGPILSVSKERMKNEKPEDILKNIEEPDNIGFFNIAIVKEVLKNETKIIVKTKSEYKDGIILFNDMSWARQKITETQVDNKILKSCEDVLNVGDIIVVQEKSVNGQYYTLEQLPEINGGVLVMNSKTGEILAMVGGYNDIPGAFNRTTQAFRQLGSTVKPFVYATALDNGFTPASIFMDANISINLGDGVVWEPQNDTRTTNGPMTLRSGLERSRNTITIRIADAIGVKKIRQNIIKLGINDNPDDNLGISIGSVETSLIKLVSAFSIFNNNGILPLTHIISSIEDLNNIEDKNYKNEFKENNYLKETSKNDLNKNTLFEKIFFSNCDINNNCKIFAEESDKNIPNNIEKRDNNDNNKDTINELTNNKLNDKNNQKDKKIFSPETSYQILNILQGAVIRGTSRGLSGLNIPLAAKTGTSNGGKDLWTIAITPELTIGVYIGYDIPTETNNYGGQYALPVVREILSKINLNQKDFKTPENINFIKINRITGKQTNQNDNKDVIFEVFKKNDVLPQFEDSITNENNEESGEQEKIQNENIDLTDL